MVKKKPTPAHRSLWPGNPGEESTLPCFGNGESYSVYAFYDDYNDDCFKDDDDTNNGKEDYKNKNDYISFI